ncbi:MAG: ABC transporter permease [Bilophila wadsworthia]
MSQYQQVKTHRQRALILLPILSLSLFFLSWELIVDMGLVPQTLLASPSAVVELFFAKLANASPDGMLLQEHAWISIKEAFLGYFLALAVGIPLGLAMGWFRLAEGLARPIFEFIRPIPPIAWIPLTIYWFGIGLTGKVFIIWIGGIVPCVIFYVGVRMTNPVFLQMGSSTARRTGSFSGPYASPRPAYGLRRAQIALAWCWMNLWARNSSLPTELGFLIQCGRKPADRIWWCSAW